MRCRRWICASLAIVMLAAVPVSSAGAESRTALRDATQRLQHLERRIVETEGGLEVLRDRLTNLSADVRMHQHDHERARGELRRAQARLSETRTELDEHRERLRARARAVYKQGLASWFDMLAGARSLSELRTRAGYLLNIVQHDADLAERVRILERRQAAEETDLDTLLSDQARRLRTVTAEHNDVAAVLDRQQEQLEELDRLRFEAGELVEELRGRLRAEMLEGAERAAGRGTPLSFGEWAERFLETLGAPVTHNNIAVVVAWQAAEYTRATWNPLATTYRMPGATVFNDHGVRNFTSLEQGLEATVRTLRRPGHGYEAVVDALMRSADPMTTALAINASNWCRGCAGGNYLIGIVSAVESRLDSYAAR